MAARVYTLTKVINGCARGLAMLFGGKRYKALWRFQLLLLLHLFLTFLTL